MLCEAVRLRGESDKFDPANKPFDDLLGEDNVSDFNYASERDLAKNC